MTAWGKEQYETTNTDIVINGETVGSSKDPMIKCDPLGWPRSFTYNYGFEVVHAQQTTQFFDGAIHSEPSGWIAGNFRTLKRSIRDGWIRSENGRRYAGHRVDRV